MLRFERRDVIASRGSNPLGCANFLLTRFHVSVWLIHMELKITANYPKNQVKDIVNLAYDFVFAGTMIKPPDYFKVWVKNSEYAHAGRFYGHKISMRIGRPNQFPCKYSYPRLKTAPEYTLNDWKEGLFVLAVHEFWHYYQMKTSSPFSEIETERRVVMALEKFRTIRHELKSKWKTVDEKQQVKDNIRRQKQAEKETPAYELQQLHAKITKVQRRIKLYQTKMKKLLRRQKHLQKKISNPN